MQMHILLLKVWAVRINPYEKITRFFLRRNLKLTYVYVIYLFDKEYNVRFRKKIFDSR